MAERWLVETALNERWSFYTRANVGEVFPDPGAPASFSFAFQDDSGLRGAELGFRNAFLRLGAFDPDEFPPDECLFLGVANGYCYLNAGALRIIGHRSPGMTAADIDASFFGDAPGVPPFVPQPGDDRPDLTEKIGATFQWALTTDGLPEVTADEDWLRELRAARRDPATLSDRELLDQAWEKLDDRFNQLFTNHLFVSFVASLPFGIVMQVCAALGRPEAALSLMAGLGDVESAAPSLAMWDLGREVAVSPSLSAAFDGPAAGRSARLRSDDNPEVQAWLGRFDEFLVRYGSRGPNEWETRSPTWETHPDLALAAIDRMRLSPEESSPHKMNRDRSEERKALGAELAAMLDGDPETQAQFVASLHAITVFLPGRERTKSNCIKLIQETRVLLREFGRRMVERGVFPQIESYGMVTRAESYALLADTTGWHDALVERERLYDEVKGLQEPFLFVGAPPPMSTYPSRASGALVQAKPGEVLVGVPGCPGRAVGRARVVLDSHDPSALEPGDVLVAPLTDPSWTPLFVPACAVVVDVGAPLSHAIIVSRELGIPCAVSVTDGTRRIPDGALVEVDGTTGTVTVLELPVPAPA